MVGFLKCGAIENFGLKFVPLHEFFQINAIRAFLKLFLPVYTSEIIKRGVNLNIHAYPDRKYPR